MAKVEEVGEQNARTETVKQFSFKIVALIIASVVVTGLIIAYFLLKSTPPVKSPAPKEQVSRLTPTLAPLTISEKPQTEMFMDIKNQLIKAFR